MGLCVCSACNRHVKECSAVCPFCGAAFVGARVTCAEPSARVAAAAAIGAAVVLASCTSATSSSSYGGSCAASGCYEPPQDASTNRADVTVGTADSGEPDSGTAQDAGSETGSDAEASDLGDAGEGRD